MKRTMALKADLCLLTIVVCLITIPSAICEVPATAVVTDAAAFEGMVNYCCSEGIKWSEARNTCNKIKSVSEPIPLELMSVCLGTAEICCTRQYRSVECIEGMKSAKGGSTCNRDPKTITAFESDYFKDCCEACKIGLVMSTTVNQCGLKDFTFGSPWDEVSRSCCDEAVDQNVFELDESDQKDLCGRFENLCSQICENSDFSYICKCNPGFVLLEDKITCAPVVANISENLINDKGKEGCPKGYIKDIITLKCIDMDECEMGESDCDSTQICRNEEGGYKCVDVISPSPEDCKAGFRFNVVRESCDDINECLEELDNCTKAEQVCLNTRGGYKCQRIPKEECVPGFNFDNLTKSCEDIDECIDEATCGKGKICVNKPGHYECVDEPEFRATLLNNPLLPNTNRKISCQMGFRWKGDKCIDIDECASDKSACDSNQICINDPGGFHCDCKEGFQLDPTINACVDVNECQINNHECLEHQRCDNTIGSYTCIRLHSCGTGYTFNAATANCDDDDECALKTHNCQAPYECRNTKGSFRCERVRITTPPPTTTTTSTTTKAPATTPRYYPPFETRTPYYTRPTYRPYYPPATPASRYQNIPCDPGFERSVQGACIDIDECRMEPCRRNQRCRNTNGSYRCENLINCPGGYRSNDDGTRCIDVDECATGEATCGTDQICKNKEGGYICSCPPGFMLSADRRCEDMDECKFSGNTVCPSNARCHNTIGSYTCECQDGFRKHAPAEKTCYDVDECKEQQGICHQRCINIFGSFRCACEAGYKLSADNRTCHDIDECEIHKSYNLCVGRCENTQGSYVCTCPPGYRLGLDGRTCQDIDECAEEHPCRGHNEICMNIRGSYRCNRITCPPEYTLDDVKKNRCRRISMVCNHDDLECFQKPSSYSHNYITLASKMSVPPQGRALFTLKGSNYYESTQFDLRMISARVPGGVEKAEVDYFSVQKMHSEGVLYLTRSLEGPQEIELEFTMTVFQKGMPSGRTVAKIFIVVSEHTF